MAKKTIVLTSLGIVSLISVLFSAGLIIGYVVGRHFSKRILEGKSRLKPLIFHVRNWKIHLHHWFLSILAFFSIVVAGYFAHLPGIFYGVLGGLVLQDIYWEKRWYKKHFYCEDKWYKILSRKA